MTPENRLFTILSDWIDDKDFQERARNLFALTIHYLENKLPLSFDICTMHTSLGKVSTPLYYYRIELPFYGKNIKSEIIVGFSSEFIVGKEKNGNSILFSGCFSSNLIINNQNFQGIVMLVKDIDINQDKIDTVLKTIKNTRGMKTFVHEFKHYELDRILKPKAIKLPDVVDKDDQNYYNNSQEFTTHYQEIVNEMLRTLYKLKNNQDLDLKEKCKQSTIDYRYFWKTIDKNTFIFDEDSIKFVKNLNYLKKKLWPFYRELHNWAWDKIKIENLQNVKKSLHESIEEKEKLVKNQKSYKWRG